jgi:hypothetical protein
MPFGLQGVRYLAIRCHLTLLASEKGGVHYISPRVSGATLLKVGGPENV